MKNLLCLKPFCWEQTQKLRGLGVVADTCSHNTWESQGGEWYIWGHHGIHSKILSLENNGRNIQNLVICFSKVASVFEDEVLECVLLVLPSLDSLT